MRGHVRRRGQRWAVVLSLGRNAEGKRLQKWSSHATRREAEVHLAHLLAQVHAGGGVPPTRLRTADYLEQWLRDYAGGAVAVTTFDTYQSVVRRHLAPSLGHIPLARLSAQAIQSYLSHALQNGLSTTTTLYHHRILHGALRHAVRWGLLVRNPCDFVDPPKKRQLELRVLDEEQIRLFLGAAKKSSPYALLYAMAITTGMRQGELLGLRWKDLDFTLGTATVHQTFYRLGGRQLFKAPKTRAARRAIALPPLLVEDLRRLRDEQPERRRLLGAEYDDHNLVFCQLNGRPLHAHNITQRDMRRVLKQAGLPAVCFHSLRHGHASYLLRAGVNPKVIQERLGHSTPAFTLAVYGHVLPGMQEDAARMLEARLRVI